MKAIKQVRINERPAVLVAVVVNAATGGTEQRYFSPDTPRPINNIVGQFAGKFVSPSWRDNITGNNDTSTHIDVDAWMTAFKEVYSRS
jgi:hypothetical protein